MKTASIWLQHIPIPRIIELAVEELKKGSLADDFLEDILPHVCFSLPPNADLCSQLLQSIPQSSKVWDRLEGGLLEHKIIPIAVIALLFEHRLTSLEKVIFEVLSCYAEISSSCDKYNVCDFTIEDFKHRLSVQDDREIAGAPTRSAAEVIPNFWKNSFVIDAAIQSGTVFKMCLRMFLKLAVDTKFSMTFLFAMQDFSAILFRKLDKNLYKYFPSKWQHIAFLLTLPLAPGNVDIFSHSQIQVIEDALLNVMKNEGDVVVRSLLCFFPYWLPVLLQNQFLDRYLKFIPWDNTDDYFL